MGNEFDSYAKDYQHAIEKTIGVFGQKHDFFVRDKVERLIESFGEIGPSQELKVLDVGCGIGLGHSDITKVIGKLYGVDVSKESIDLAGKNNPSASYQVYDGVKLPYEDNFFDCAYAICVLHHVPKNQWDQFIIEMKRVIRPGGQLIVIEHNPLNPATQWVVRTCELDKNAILLPPWRLYRLFVGAGLNLPKISYTLFTPFSHVFFRKLDRLLCRIPFGAQYLIKARKLSVMKQL